MRGSLPVYGRESDMFYIVNLRGPTPSAMTVRLPKAPRAAVYQFEDSFSSDDDGRWAISAGDVIYASDGKSTSNFHPLGCRAP